MKTKMLKIKNFIIKKIKLNNHKIIIIILILKKNLYYKITVMSCKIKVDYLKKIKNKQLKRKKKKNLCPLDIFFNII